MVRPKQALLYQTVGNWWQNQQGGGVHYVAHAVTAGNVVALGPVRAEIGGGTPANHPDQQFWAHANQVHWPPAANVLRVEIDCSLMPCVKDQGACLFTVPNWLRNNYLANTPLRVFSHRNEGMGVNAGQNKRVILCNTGDANAALQAAFNAHQSRSGDQQTAVRNDGGQHASRERDWQRHDIPFHD